MSSPETTRDALADLRAEIHLWTGDESTPVDLDVLRRAAGEIERLRARLQEIARLRLATNEGSLRVRADRMWEIAEGRSHVHG